MKFWNYFWYKPIKIIDDSASNMILTIDNDIKECIGRLRSNYWKLKIELWGHDDDKGGCLFFFLVAFST